MGLADTLHALYGRISVFCGGVLAHVPRPVVWQLPQTARAGLDFWLRHLFVLDG